MLVQVNDAAFDHHRTLVKPNNEYGLVMLKLDE